MAGTIKIAILAEAAKAKAELASVGKAAEGMASKLKGGVALAAGAAGVALGVMAKDAIAGARESAEIHRVLESQIKGMGAAAATAFGSATKFAEDYGKAIGKDDDDILKVVNKLSTFPAAFGKGSLGAEGMRRATQAAFDLEAAGVGSAESNIIGLGKAMDNPIKGLTALSKSGVSFTAEQKKQIEQYTKQGKLAEAQKVLLQGIESNAKGAANAQADGLTRAKVALDGFAEGLASKVLPYLDKFGAWFTDKGLPAIERFGAWFGTNVAPVIGAAFEVAKTAAAGFVSALSNPAVQAFAASILTIVAGLKIYQTTMVVIRAATAAWAAVQAALNVVMAANPIGLIVLAIAALVAGLIVAYRQSETFRNIVQGVWAAVQAAISAVIEWFTTTIPQIWESAKAMWDGVVAGAQATWNAIKDAASATLDAITATWDAIKSAAAAAWNAIKAAAETAWNAIKAAVQLVITGIRLYLEAYKTVVLAIWTAIKVAAEAVWNGIKVVVGLVVNAITALLNGYKTVALAVWSAIRTVGETTWNAIKTAVQRAIDTAKSIITGFKNSITGIFSNAGTLLADAGRRIIQGLWDGLKAKWESVKAWFGSITSQIPNLKGPPGKDAKLLRKSGQLVIGGFLTGLESQYGEVRSSLAGFTNSLSTSAGVSGSVGVIDPGTAAAAGTPTAVTINGLTVTVPGSFDLSSPAERKAAAEAMVREIQEALVAYEGSRR